MLRFLLPLLFHLFGLGCLALPLQTNIFQRQSECLYDTFDADEHVTISVIILSGSPLKATVALEGPFATPDEDTGAMLFQKAQEFDNGNKPNGHLSFIEVVDFEHLNVDIPDDDEHSDEKNNNDDILKTPIDPNDPDADQKRRERRERQRQKFLEEKQKREERKLAQLKKVRQDGEPFVHTVKINRPGWYRMCVTSSWSQILAEMEMRKESDLGGLDEDGHVKSYEEQRLLVEDEELERDTASEEGITDEDFKETRERVKDLRRLLNEIQSLQQRERRRLTVHAETNEHSHSRMVLSSLMETLLFMGVTGFQVYTIRKWFSGAPALGR
ncbi:emp24/gp25L/p24 family protein [Nitzschia inconspicua]|uniref:Emp24/gp25L/p24 family protein n=1 Tax=Nitzschia inconspicua TaxID=303405 RepID=A0A9K3LJ11_9STRA|nr:emp24/gp25L/p24 family protein [Nitzschia inconspicua]